MTNEKEKLREAVLQAPEKTQSLLAGVWGENLKANLREFRSRIAQNLLEEKDDSKEKKTEKPAVTQQPQQPVSEKDPTDINGFPITAAPAIRPGEMNLDPNFDKEFFVRSYTKRGHEITLKSIGTGPTAPILIYIDGKRWELFPGPEIATKNANEFVNRQARDSSFVKTIATAKNEGSAIWKDENGGCFTLTEKDASSLARLYDLLTEENQTAMLEKISINSLTIRNFVDYFEKHNQEG